MWADILTVLILAVIFLPVAWLFVRSQTRYSRAAKRRRMAEPRTHGDEGGFPVVKGRVEILPRRAGK